MISPIDSGYWLAMVKVAAYKKSPHGQLKKGRTYSSFGVFLQLSGVTWEEHPNSPGVFYPEDAPFYCAALPAEFLDRCGEPGQLYKKYFRVFLQISEMPFKHQVPQIVSLLEKLRAKQPTRYIKSLS